MPQLAEDCARENDGMAVPALVDGAHDRSMGGTKRPYQRRNSSGRDHRCVHGRHQQSRDSGTVRDGKAGKHRSQLASVRTRILDVPCRHRQPLDLAPERVVFDPPDDQHFVHAAGVERLGKTTDEALARRTAGQQSLRPTIRMERPAARMIPGITEPVYGRRAGVTPSVELRAPCAIAES